MINIINKNGSTGGMTYYNKGLEGTFVCVSHFLIMVTVCTAL